MAHYLKNTKCLLSNLINVYIRKLFSNTFNQIQSLPQAQAKRFTTLNTSQGTSIHPNTSVIVPKVPEERFADPKLVTQSPKHCNLSNKGLQIHSKRFLKNIHHVTYLQTLNFSTTLRKAREMIPGSDYAASTFITCGEEERKRIKITRCPVLPPCLKFVQPPGQKKTYDIDKIKCGRICMPCCPLARYPPVCYDIKPKIVCNRKPNPRPSYSECAKDCIKMRSVCDCCSIKPPPCRLLPEIMDECK